MNNKQQEDDKKDILTKGQNPKNEGSQPPTESGSSDKGQATPAPEWPVGGDKW